MKLLLILAAGLVGWCARELTRPAPVRYAYRGNVVRFPIKVWP